MTDDSESYEDITRKAYDYFANEGLGKYLVIQTYFERVHLKFLSSLPVGGLGLDLVHDNGYNLKQIEDGISIKVKHFMQESLMAEMYGRLILKQNN